MQSSQETLTCKRPSSQEALTCKRLSEQETLTSTEIDFCKNFKVIHPKGLFVFGPSRTSRRVLSFAFLPGSARLCVFFSTPVTRIDGLGRRVLCFAFLLGSARLCVIFSTPVTRIDGLGGGGVRVGGGWGGCLIAFCRLLPVASSFRHAHDATLYRSSLAILDTLMMGGVGGGSGWGGWGGA